MSDIVVHTITKRRINKIISNNKPSVTIGSISPKG